MSNDKENKEKGWLSGYIFEKMRLPSDLLRGEFRAELRGRGALYLYGCGRIKKYSDSEMIFSARDIEVTVTGVGMTCSFFYGGSVAIEGRIEGFHISEAREGGRA